MSLSVHRSVSLTGYAILLTAIFMFARPLAAGPAAQTSPEVVPAPEADPHYTDVGFFDIHVCNWPDNQKFLMGLFSTFHFNDIQSIELFDNRGKSMGQLDPERYRLVPNKEKKEKRVYIKHFSVPADNPDGWYSALITMNNGRKYLAKDYVVAQWLGIGEAVTPADQQTAVALPVTLSWKAIPGAKHYRVFIKDEWAAQTVHESPVLDKPQYVLPKGVLEPGGEYSWRIHARDVNENALLGDFNHGSLSQPFSFTVAE